jgi:hypothetical protein
MYLFRLNTAIESNPAGGQVAQCTADILDAAKSANRNIAAMVVFVLVFNEVDCLFVPIESDKSLEAEPGAV